MTLKIISGNRCITSSLQALGHFFEVVRLETILHGLNDTGGNVHTFARLFVLDALNMYINLTVRPEIPGRVKTFKAAIRGRVIVGGMLIQHINPHRRNVRGVGLPILAGTHNTISPVIDKFFLLYIVLLEIGFRHHAKQVCVNIKSTKPRRQRAGFGDVSI